MLEKKYVFEILPIKPGFDKKQVKKAHRRILKRYLPDKVRNVNPEELKDKLMDKYREISSLANSTLSDIEDGNQLYNSPEDYGVYKNSFKKKLDDLNKSKLIVILEANKLSTDGNKTQLQSRILENVPSKIADLNITEHDLRIKEILKGFRENKLVRILQLKNIQPNGNSTALINKIASNISKNEINKLINQVDREINDAKEKLNGLNDQQLKQILDNNKFDSKGEKPVLIKTILENVPIAEFDDNINIVCIKQNVLKKLYSITGKDELLESYKQKLATNHLEIDHGIQIRNKMVSLIDNGQIEEDEIELKLDELINEKSQEINEDVLDDEKLEILYGITGKTTFKSSFIELLSNWGLDKQDGVQIINEFISLIKTTDIDKNKIHSQLLETIKQESFKKLINNCDISYLDQLALMNNLSKCNTKEEYVELFFNSFSTFGTDFKIRSDISKIDNAKRRLVKLYKKQLEFILVYNNVSSEGTRNELIDNIISNIPITRINLILSEIEKIMDDLNQLTINDLCFVLNGNNSECSGEKTYIITEINKTMPFDLIRKNIHELGIKQKVLKKLYSITGKYKLLESYKQKLATNHLEINHGIQIRNKMVSLIDNGQIEEDEIELKLDELINEKSQEINDDILEELYKITGKVGINSNFLKKLKQAGLDENDGVQIKNEVIADIKSWKVGKDNLLEHVNIKISQKKLINEKLVKLYKKQLEFILVYNNVSSEGTRNELINKIISNIPISCINLILSEIEKIMDDLNQLTIKELCFILKGNNSECSGEKTYIITEINKTMPVDLIKKNIIELNKFKPILNELNFNELKFIAKSNNLIVKDNKNQLIVEIGTQVPINIISENILEINNINASVKSFNKLQRQHILKSNLLNDVGDDETQIKKILENIDLFEIANFNKELNEIKYELNNLSVIQLNHILNNHNLEKSDNSFIQIETILENILIPFIKRDIQSIKELKNKIDALSEDEIDIILLKNKLRKSIHKNENIKTIVENLPYDKIKEYLSGINNDAYLKELKNSTLICPIKISKGKKTLTTEKRGKSIFLLLFNNEELFNEYQQNNKSVKMLENNLDYFKKIINKNRKVEGILVKTPEEIIIRKD